MKTFANIFGRNQDETEEQFKTTKSIYYGINSKKDLLRSLS